MERFFGVIKNKYLLAAIGFIVWMCFFDRYDVATQYSYQTQKNTLEKEKIYFETEIETMEKSIHDMQYNKSEIERVAREKYKMKKPQEDVYVISELD